MLIRKAEIEELDVLVRVYDDARAFMRSEGNDAQWINGYPQRELLSDDIARGHLYVCEGGPQLFQWSSLTEPVNGVSGNDTDTAAMLEALENFERESLAHAGVYAVFYFEIGDDPSYREIDGAWLAEGKYGAVHRLAVAKRGQGAGTFCMEWALRKTREAKATGGVRVDTHECNKPMRAMLEKVGFTACGTIVCQDGTPRMAYQMV